MKRIAWIILSLAALLLAVSTISEWMKSPEDLIREVITDGIAAFNEPDASDSVSGFAPDFRDDVYGLGKSDLHQILAGLFLREHRSSGEPSQLALDEDGMDILLEGEERATAQFRLIFKRGKTELCRLDVVAAFELRDGDWLVATARHEVVDGRLPF